MLEIFRSGGIVMWPMLVVGVGVIVLCGQAVRRQSRGGAGSGADPALHSILFWGVVAMVLGVLGSVLGFVQMGQAIMAVGATEISAATLWGGISVALVSTIFGLLIFLVALIGWFVLESRGSGGRGTDRAAALA